MQTANPNYGAVFTRRWVVEMMLDLCGYDPAKDLASMTAVEPSCGDGAFLLPMVERLSRSLRLHNRALSDSANAIFACDLQEQHVEHVRRRVIDLLTTEGWSRPDASDLALRWIRHRDYLLGEQPTADFVIGNPPYIRSGDMQPELREAYLATCQTMTKGTDIYVGFIERGLESLSDNGVLCFICADRWMHNAYGRRLRRMVVDHYAVDAMIEMHGADAFAEEVSSYPAVIMLSRAPQQEVLFATANGAFGCTEAERLHAWRESNSAESFQSMAVRADVLPHWFATDDVWPSASPARLRLIEDLEERFLPLQHHSTGTKVGIGIATGADKVFITEEPLSVERERLVPLVKTRHLNGQKVEWESAPSWLINPWDKDGALVDLSCYPKLGAHLAEHRDVLTRRHVAKKSPSGWYRTIDKIQPGLLEQPKLLIQDMKATIQPFLDPGNLYPHHNLYWITSDEWDSRVLGGLLLSHVAQLFVEAYGVKMRGGTLRFQAQYLRKIRVPSPDSIPQHIKNRLERAFDSRDSEEATQAALIAYKIDELPD